MSKKSIKDVFMGIIIGIVLIIVSFPLLIWNEGRAVQTAQSLEEGAEAVVSVESEEINPDNEGELVHVIDTAVTDDILSDSSFPLEREALALRRSVEMYQWHEEESTEGTGDRQRTVYNYHQDWSSRVIDSSRFNDSHIYQNPSEMPYDDETRRADHVNVGAFELSSRFIDQIRNFSPVALDDEFAEAAEAVAGQSAQIHGDYLFLGYDPNNPSTGDVRITFEKVEPHTVSAIGQQSGSMLSGYATDAGDTLALLSQGQRSADEMFEDAMAANVMMTWMIRIGGTMAMFFGFVLLFGPVSFVARFIPVVGPMIIGAKKLVAAGLTFVLAGGAIAFGWVLARPLIGIPMLLFVLGAGGGLLFLAYKKFQEKQAEEGAQPAADGSA